jgi:hypothetical protein
MSSPMTSADLAFTLERHVQMRTNWRVRNLAIEVADDRAVLRGQATTNFTRLLAQRTVQDFLPNVRLENALAVENGVEFLLGLPTN